MGNAIGLIETRGLVTAVEAVDVCLKAANVEFAFYKFTTGGLVCVIVSGEVGAVRAAVDAGGAAARKVGEVIAVHVIPRPAGDVVHVMDNKIKREVVSASVAEEAATETMDKYKSEEETIDKAEAEGARAAMKDVNEMVKLEETKEEAEDRENYSEIAEKGKGYSEEFLDKVTYHLQAILADRKEDVLEEDKRIDKYGVGTLRKTLRVLSIEKIDKTSISTMRKKEILDTIIDYVLQAGGEEVYDELR